MIVSIHGARFYGSQIERTESGFMELGHTLGYNAKETPHFIYSNDASHYHSAIIEWEKHKRLPKLILNVLDVPDFLPEINLIKSEWLPKLLLANKVTSISKFTQNAVKEHFGIDSEVIYNPVKDVCSVYREDTAKSIPFLYVGRANSINKRFRLIIETFRLAGWKDEILFVIGSENPRFGQYQGVVDNKDLNTLYNLAKFVLLPSFFEGMGLPAIEAMICGTIPIVCSDNLGTKEFMPPEFVCDPNPQSYLNKISELNKDYDKYQKIALEYGDKYKEQFSGKSIANNILKVYESLV